MCPPEVRRRSRTLPRTVGLSRLLATVSSDGGPARPPRIAAEFELPLGEAEVVQEGSDITCVAWGAQMEVCRATLARTLVALHMHSLTHIARMHCR